MVAEKIVVGISEMAVSNRPDDTLITYSLGSCLGLTAYDPQACIGGLIHCMLPLSSVDEKKSKEAPAMFVDTGVSLLFNKILDLGADKNRIVVKAAGCAQLLDPQKLFNIGERNFTVLRKILWKNNLLIKGQNIGGSVSRTVWLDMSTGKTIVKQQGQEVEI